MKKRNILKISLVMAFAVIAVSKIQADPPWTQMQQEPSTIDTITDGAVIPYWVEPDAVLNESFAGAYDTSQTNAAQNLQSVWTWWLNSGAAVGSQVSHQAGGGEGQGPYVDVTWSDNGNDVDTLFVREESSTGCVGDTSLVRVAVVAQPDFTVSDATDDDTVRICEGSESQTITLSSIADNGVGGGTLKFRLDISVDTLNSDQTVDANVRESFDTVVQIGITSGNDVTLMPYTIGIIGNQITQYRFAFDNTLDATNQNGMSDKISRKSDFLDLATKDGSNDQEYTYYTPNAAGDTDMITYIIFPAPDTGPLYYLPNDFNN